jgi:hypothetical protein
MTGLDLADAVRQLVITKMLPQEGLEARLCQVVCGPVPAEPPHPTCPEGPPAIIADAFAPSSIWQ